MLRLKFILFVQDLELQVFVQHEPSHVHNVDSKGKLVLIQESFGVNLVVLRLLGWFYDLVNALLVS